MEPRTTGIPPLMSDWKALGLLRPGHIEVLEERIPQYTNLDEQKQVLENSRFSRDLFFLSTATTAICAATAWFTNKDTMSWGERNAWYILTTAGTALTGAFARRLYNSIRAFQKFVNEEHERLSSEELIRS